MFEATIWQMGVDMSQIINQNYSSIEQMTNALLNNKKTVQSSNSQNSTTFEEVLDKLQQSTQTSELKFSKHANERLSSRSIDLTQNQLERLETGTKKAEEKGIKESLVMVDDLAFIVNIKNNTVITAVNNSEDNVFTNIDGAVIA